MRLLNLRQKVGQLVDLMIDKIFDKCPEFVWAFLSKVSEKYWVKVNGCTVCHYWRARLHGWIDAIFIIILLRLIYGF